MNCFPYVSFKSVNEYRLIKNGVAGVGAIKLIHRPRTSFTPLSGCYSHWFQCCAQKSFFFSTCRLVVHKFLCRKKSAFFWWAGFGSSNGGKQKTRVPEKKNGHTAHPKPGPVTMLISFFISRKTILAEALTTIYSSPKRSPPKLPAVLYLCPL